MRGVWIGLGIAAAVGSVVGVASALFLARSPAAAWYSDGGTIRRPVDAEPARHVLWQAPESLDIALPHGEQVYEPRLSWDGARLFFVRGKAGANADIFVATRTPTGWSEPRSLDAINTSDDELGPELSPDGTALLFYSNRPGGLGGYDIWQSRLSDGSWQAPTNLGEAVNSPFNDYGPALSPDGATLYFASNRPLASDARQPNPDAWAATAREEWFHRTYDLYRAAVSERGFGTCEPLAPLNTPANEAAPCVSPAGDFLYFASDRPGGRGGFDLLRSRIVRGAVQSPENLGPTINTAANELDPAAGRLGFELFFSSDRANVFRSPDAAAYRLYYTASREVFIERQPERPTDWAALLAAIWPNLRWLLLGLILLALLLLAGRDLARRRLGLMTRCVLASLAAHLLFMILLNFWRVTATVVEFAQRGGGPIEVSLAGDTVGGDLFAQINASPVESAAARVESVEVDAAPLVDVETVRATAMARPQAPAAEFLIDASRIEVEMREAETPVMRGETPQVVGVESADVPAAVGDLARRAVDVGAARLPEVSAPLARPAEGAPAATRFAGELPPPMPVASVSAGTLFVATTPVVRGVADARAAWELVADVGDLVREVRGRDVLPTMAAGTRELSATALEPPSEARTDATAAIGLPRPAAPRAADSDAAERTASEDRAASLPAVAVAAMATPERAAQEDGRASRERRTTAAHAPARASGDVVLAADVELPQNPRNDGVQFDGDRAAASRGGDLPTDALQLPPSDVAGATPLRLPKADDAALATRNDATASRGGEQKSLGAIVGTVRDAEGKPIAGAGVRLDSSGRDAASAVTDADGAFRLQPADPPEFAAVSASASGFVPQSLNVARRALEAGDVTLEFALAPLSDRVIALEARPTVHHLGNDRFEGRVNSQFQKRSEGVVLVMEFDVTQQQLEQAGRRSKLMLLTRGVQCSHPVWVNNQLLDATLDASRPDGSFGEQRISFATRLLTVGRNALMIRAIDCAGDIDDFELVNVRVRLQP